MELETRVYLGVFDFGNDPNVVSDLMGVPPTEAWVKGEYYSSKFPLAVRTHSRWMLSSGLPLEAGVEDHLRALLVRLQPLRSQIMETAARFDVGVGIAQTVRKCNVEAILDPEVVRGLAELGVWIRLDQYFLGYATDS
jgi:hypothetical protein